MGSALICLRQSIISIQHPCQHLANSNQEGPAAPSSCMRKKKQILTLKIKDNQYNGKKMSNSKLKLKAVFVPRFGSQSCRTPVKEYVIELPPSTGKYRKVTMTDKFQTQSEGEVRKGSSNKRVKTTQPPPKKRKNDDKTQKSPVLTTREKKKTMSVCRGGGAGPQSQKTSQSSSSQGSSSTSLVDDVYTFSQGSSDTPSNKMKHEKAKLAVLQTISKVLRENRCIRARLTSLKQASNPI